MNIEDEIRFLWTHGHSRNEISKTLHIGHNRVQRIAQSIDRTSHASALQTRTQRINLKAKELQRDLGFKFGEAKKHVSERSKEGIETRYNPENLERFLQGDRRYSP